jgi:hypothetical protein
MMDESNMGDVCVWFDYYKHCGRKIDNDVKLIIMDKDIGWWMMKLFECMIIMNNQCPWWTSSMNDEQYKIGLTHIYFKDIYNHFMHTSNVTYKLLWTTNYKGSL